MHIHGDAQLRPAGERRLRAESLPVWFQDAAPRAQLQHRPSLLLPGAADRIAPKRRGR